MEYLFIPRFFIIFATEKELDAYIHEYMRKHAKLYIKDIKSQINQHKQWVIYGEKELAKRENFIKINNLM